MTRVQLLLDKREIRALHQQARQTHKSYSQLVREAIDNTYISDFGEEEIAQMAREARGGRRARKFKDAKSFLKYLWSL